MRGDSNLLKPSSVPTKTCNSQLPQPISESLINLNQEDNSPILHIHIVYILRDKTHLCVFFLVHCTQKRRQRVQEQEKFLTSNFWHYQIMRQPCIMRTDFPSTMIAIAHGDLTLYQKLVVRHKSPSRRYVLATQVSTQHTQVYRKLSPRAFNSTTQTTGDLKAYTRNLTVHGSFDLTKTHTQK